MKENILGTEKISKLIMKFSIPCIISLLVNSLYNIVDQIFIGWGVGYLGNGATNIVFPLNMLALAIALMLGDGTSAYLSLKLGEKKKKEASSGVVNGVVISTIISILFFIIIEVFLSYFLKLFGATKTLMPYALNYGRFIGIGLPFMMIGTTLNSIIRADGEPSYAMKSMIIGAVLNTILDPIFIFVFKMGVSGAAIATAISQFVTFFINIIYIKRFKSIDFSVKNYKLNFPIIRKISMLGISSFITQISIVLVIAVENNLLSKYGALSSFGSEIPITVLGIVMKISQILNSIIIGISVGAQPIIGYNYGAGNNKRVLKCLKIVLTLSIIISFIAFILFQTIPDKLIYIFGSGNDKYIEFACMAFRTYLMLYVLGAVQISSGIFFQAIGKSVKSAVLSLSRQVLILVPGMFIFGYLLGINGILYAGPVADLIAFLLSITFLIFEVKNLKNNKELVIEQKSVENKVNILDRHIVITISREYASGGRYIGKLVSQKLGIKLYDKEIISRVADETGLGEKYIRDNEQKKNKASNLNNGYYYGLDNSDELYLKEAEIIKKVAKNESCVIVGRCADYILKDNKDVKKIFIYSDIDSKINRAVKYYNIPKNKAKKEINKINKLRANHYKYYTDRNWYDYNNYDLCINSDVLGVEKTAELICNMIVNK